MLTMQIALLSLKYAGEVALCIELAAKGARGLIFDTAGDDIKITKIQRTVGFDAGHGSLEMPCSCSEEVELHPVQGRRNCSVGRR